jgi:hypothetical protein
MYSYVTNKFVCSIHDTVFWDVTIRNLVDTYISKQRTAVIFRVKEFKQTHTVPFKGR